VHVTVVTVSSGGFRRCANAQGSKAVIFLCRGVVVPDKALSFHAKAVRGFNKGKAAKGLQCGRAFQLGRLGGNVLLVAACTTIRMEDKAAVRPMIDHRS
jgi:hypothetical protein